MKNALTVDVEDFYQVSAWEPFIARSEWENYPQRVEYGTKIILEKLSEKGIYGTFFILGWIGRRYPKLIQEIASRGHELGFHSGEHHLLYHQTPEKFREDLRCGKRELEDQTGQEVTAFRAPSFSITTESLWALELLVEEGFQYDSSLFPIHHDRYGIPGAPIRIHPIRTASGTLWEFPPSVVRFGKWNFPVSGGGYFRLYPYALSRFCLQRVNRNRPFVFYIHPWELDPEQPILPFGSRTTQFRHRVGLRKNASKLERLLKDFAFGKLSEVVENEKATWAVSSD